MPRPEPFNHAVLCGRITSEPVARELSTGEQVVGFDVSTCDPDGRRVSVPVSWSDPPAARRVDLAADADVVVAGWVRRRFFRAAGVTQSRTEVVALEVLPARRRRSVARLLGRLVDSLVDS